MTPEARSQCQEIVYVPDTYRRTGRGAGGFQMHYSRQRCKRLSKAGSIHCWQHERRCFNSHAS